MKKQIVIISFTKQGFQLALRMRSVLTRLPDDWIGKEKRNDQRQDMPDRNIEKTVALYTTKASVAEQYPEAVLVTEGLLHWCGQVFAETDALIFIGASGIAVRSIAPFLVSKVHDPAVLVSDERGKHVISLLSGHLGGGNALTSFLAEKIGADPVITTASDVNGKLAIDVWAQKNDLVISDLKLAKRVAAEIVAGKRIPFYCDGWISGTVPEELVIMKPGARGRNEDEEDDFPKGSSFEFEDDMADIPIVVSVYDTGIRRDSIKENQNMADFLHLIPKSVILGVGCRKGKPFAEIWKEVSCIFEEHRISPHSICKVVSIDLKAGEEGLQRLADELQVPFETFSAEMLNQIPGEYESSGFVKEITGVDNVCERAAMASLIPEKQKKSHFLLRKTAKNGVTAALLEKEWGVTFE